MLKVGVIGVGTISEMHITPYLQNEDVELVALCDFHEERLAEKGKLLSVNQLYDNYQELLNNQDINTILNVTPQIDNLGFDFVKSFGNEINHFVECCQSGNKSNCTCF